MGKKDSYTKAFTSRNDVFADLFNTFIFKGKKIVDPDKLVEKDTTEIAMDAEKMIVLQKYRDVLKAITVKTDGSVNYILLGIENQSEVHYAMPVRAMLYDALNYESQVKQYSEIVRNDKKYAKMSAEYMSGFTKNQKLIPVITMVLYWKPYSWDGPRKLSDMFDKDIMKKFGSYIEDYDLHIVCPYEMSTEQIDKLSNDLRSAMTFMKASNDPDKLDELAKNQEFRKLPSEVVRVINEMSGAKIPVKKKEVDMCEGIEILKQRAAKQAEENTLKMALINAYVLMTKAYPSKTKRAIYSMIAEQFKLPLQYVKSAIE